MFSYVLRRLINLGFLLLGISIIVFAAMHLIPGDPVNVLHGVEEGISEQTRDALKRRLGLDQSLPVQYARWLTRFLQGDWGTSYFKGQPVFNLIANRLPATFLLTISSMIFIAIISLPFGVFAASKHHTFFDRIIMIMTFLQLSIPSFWLGILLILVFSFKLRWLPSYGFAKPWNNFSEVFKHLVLPAVTLGTAIAGTLTQMIRSSLLEELHKEYLLTAKAKGLPERVVILRHALRNSLIPSVTTLGMWFGVAMSGSVVVETVFTWPGIGRLLYESILCRDYPVVQSIVLVFATTCVLVNLVVDILYFILDPRVRIPSNQH